MCNFKVELYGKIDVKVIVTLYSKKNFRFRLLVTWTSPHGRVASSYKIWYRYLYPIRSYWYFSEIKDGGLRHVGFVGGAVGPLTSRRHTRGAWPVESLASRRVRLSLKEIFLLYSRPKWLCYRLQTLAVGRMTQKMGFAPCCCTYKRSKNVSKCPQPPKLSFCGRKNQFFFWGGGTALSPDPSPHDNLIYPGGGGLCIYACPGEGGVGKKLPSTPPWKYFMEQPLASSATPPKYQKLNMVNLFNVLLLNVPFLFELHQIWSVESHENHQNCCHQMTDFKANMYQIRFRLSHHQKLANDQVISKITKKHQYKYKWMSLRSSKQMSSVDSRTQSVK